MHVGMRQKQYRPTCVIKFVSNILLTAKGTYQKHSEASSEEKTVAHCGKYQVLQLRRQRFGSIQLRRFTD